MCITPTDATVQKSTNQDWVMLGLRFWSVHYTYSAWNGVYWHFVIIVDSGIPVWSVAWELWPCILGNKIITYMGECIYGLGWMFVDMIIHSLKYHIMMMIQWIDYPSQHTQETFTNICVGYYQFFLTKSIGKYYFSTTLTLSIYHQIL